jgi:hypothetical protein
VSCILRHVRLQQRLNCCALVCRSWAAAAAAAPADVEITIKSSEHCQQLQHWLTKHGAVVVRLVAHDWSGNTKGLRWLQLPLQHLTQLHSLALYTTNAQLPAQIATRSSTRKTKGSSLTGPSSSNAVGSIGSAAAATAAAAAVPPQLQKLTLHKCQLTVQLLSQLLSATALSRLYWNDAKLCVDSDRQTRQLTQGEEYSTLWQRLQLLPKLPQLEFTVDRLTAVDIAPLSNMQRLQRLTVSMVYDWLSDDESGPRELLAALQHLTELRELCVIDMAMHRVGAQRGTSYPCFSGLTASTQLTALYLTDHRSQPVPQAAFEAMFPPGRVLPQLQTLFLKGRRGYKPRAQACVSAAQVGMIAAGCPALQHVSLAGVTPDDFDLGCLERLPSGVSAVRHLGWYRPAP